MIISPKQKNRIEELFKEFKKDGTDMFPLSEKAFSGISIFFGRKPKQILFPFGKIEDTEIFIGTDVDEVPNLESEQQEIY
jgi:hypothetical protein